MPISSSVISCLVDSGCFSFIPVAAGMSLMIIPCVFDFSAFFSQYVESFHVHFLEFLASLVDLRYKKRSVLLLNVTKNDDFLMRLSLNPSCILALFYVFA